MENYIQPLAPELPGVAGAPVKVVPDNLQGGWNVYDTTKPNEPQRHFEDKEQAIIHAQRLSAGLGVSYSVEAFESRSMGC